MDVTIATLDIEEVRLVYINEDKKKKKRWKLSASTITALITIPHVVI